jgi:hypothetical protein
MVRHDCESIFYDVTTLATLFDDPHHDWGIHQSLVVDRRRTCGQGLDTGEIANPMKHILHHSCEIQITPSFVFSHRNTKVRTVSIHRHACWDPGGWKTQKMKNDTSTTECVGATRYNVCFPIVISNFTAHVWDPGGNPIDRLYSIRIHHERHTDLEKTMKTTMKPNRRNATARLYVSREVSVAPDDPDDSENL